MATWELVIIGIESQKFTNFFQESLEFLQLESLAPRILEFVSFLVLIFLLTLLDQSTYFKDLKEEFEYDFFSTVKIIIS